MATIDGDGDLDTSKNDRSTANESNSASGSFDNGRSNKGKTMQKSTSSGSILNNDSRSPPRLITSSNRTIYTAGRPPWYNAAGQFEQAFVIGLCGGSASGKTSLARKIIESLNVPWVTMLSMDAFYKVLSEEKHLLANQNEYNFDCPDAIDYDVAVSTLRKLKEGKQVEIPVYDFTTHTRLEETKTVYGANVIIFEGIVSFCNKELLELMDMKIFVDADSDIRLARRLRRDIYERGRDLEGILKQYHKSVKPSYEEYIAPSRKFADIVVPRGSENDVAIDLIVHHVNKQLAKRGYNFRAELKCAHRGQPLPSSLYIVEKSPQVTGIHTKIRSKETNRDDFIFYSKRLMRLLFEYTLSLLPFDVCDDYIIFSYVKTDMP
ncbi:Uridine-cytidine kinase-like 1 [Trichoplax sp. H2]|nr:Uridine-cytidine kinase-like 1 [Trichoplax sp. H2]|eukprot:RDD41312.1 Uridine-cytidine kinase-like 1 [Trichoplax sp. H2]